MLHASKSDANINIVLTMIEIRSIKYLLVMEFQNGIIAKYNCRLASCTVCLVVRLQSL